MSPRSWIAVLWRDAQLGTAPTERAIQHQSDHHGAESGRCSMTRRTAIGTVVGPIKPRDDLLAERTLKMTGCRMVSFEFSPRRGQRLRQLADILKTIAIRRCCSIFLYQPWRPVDIVVTEILSPSKQRELSALLVAMTPLERGILLSTNDDPAIADLIAELNLEVEYPPSTPKSSS